MSDEADAPPELPQSEAIEEQRDNDPVLTLFLIGVVVLLLLCVAIVLVGNARRPAGL